MPYFLDLVKRLENRSNEERKNTTIRILKTKDIKYKLQNYNYLGTNGSNIIVEFGKGKKYSIASAHYDAISRSPGANDDASAIAVLFKLIDNFKKRKLKNKMEFTCNGCEEKFEYKGNTLCKKCLDKIEYGYHEGHPEWRLLNHYCSYQEKAKKLREKIYKEVFNKKLLKK